MSDRKVIPGGRFARVQRWEAPGVSAGQAPPATDIEADAEHAHGLLTAEQLERIQRDAHDEGFAAGRREGLETGQAEARARVQRLAGLLDGLAQPYAELDEAVEGEMVALAVAIARQLVRRELKTQPDEIVHVVREAIRALPGAERDVRLYLNPVDVALVREIMPAVETEHAWKIADDPALTAGGCRVESEHSRIDASVENRLNAAIAQTLGGERRTDGDGAGDGG